MPSEPELEHRRKAFVGIVQVQLRDFPDRYIRHEGFRAKTQANVTNLADSQFRGVPGLAGTGTVSLESANFPGYYLRHKNFEVWVEKNDGTTVFRGDASFTQRAGLADSADGISFESYNFPGRYTRHCNNLLYLQPVSTPLDRRDATNCAE